MAARRVKTTKRLRRARSTSTKTYGDLGSHTLKWLDGSRVEARGAGQVGQNASSLSGADTKLIARSVGELDGTFDTAKAADIGLDVRKSMADYVLDGEDPGHAGSSAS